MDANVDVNVYMNAEVDLNNMDVEADLVAAEAHWAALAAAEGLGSFVNSDSDACVDVVAAQMASLTAGAWPGGGTWRSAS